MMARQSAQRWFIRPIPITFILTIVLSFAPYTVALAQQAKVVRVYPTRKKPTLHIGGMAGAVYSFAYFVPSVQQKPHFGATAGITAQLENNKFTGLHVSLLYTLRGWTESFTASETEGNNHLPKFSRYIHYIEMPVMASVHYPIGAFRLGIKFGPQVGVMLGHNDVVGNGDGFDHVANLRHEQPLTGKFAWGLAAGPSFTFDIYKHRIELEGKFYMGFNDVMPTTLEDHYSRIGEMMATVTLSYLFRLK